MPNPLSFLAFSLLAIFTPGPNNIMALCNAGRHGFRKSLPFNFGVTAGFLVLMALSVVFSYTLYGALPGVKPVMTAVGAAYMLYLAWRTFRSGGHGADNKKQYTSFAAGVILQFVNPKGVLFCITAASGYLAPYYRTLPPLALCTALLAVLVLASTCLWSAFGAAFQRFIAAHARVFNVVMALLLVYCAVSLFL